MAAEDGCHLFGNFAQRIRKSRRVGRKSDGAVVHFDLRKNEKRISIKRSFECKCAIVGKVC